jgi:integrase
VWQLVPQLVSRSLIQLKLRGPSCWCLRRPRGRQGKVFQDLLHDGPLGQEREAGPHRAALAPYLQAAKDASTSESRAMTIRAAAARPMRFHDLRHTAATLMLRAGVDAHRVQRILRHASVATTTGPTATSRSRICATR